MYLSYVCTCVLLCASLILASEFDYDGWLQLRLWHALNDDPVPIFVERGNITISSIRSGASTIAQIGLHPPQISELKHLAEQNAQYRLKATVRSSSGSETTFMSSASACNMIGSDLEDILSVWLDGTAEPVAVNLQSNGPCSVETPITKMWTTNVLVKYPDGGPIPDTATYIQKLEREREARERGEVKDNRSFLAKYWMYIVPALIFVALTSATNPEGGGGGTVQRQ